jgi:hypothetical protein
MCPCYHQAESTSHVVNRIEMPKRIVLWLSFAGFIVIALIIGLNPPVAAQGDITPKTATLQPSPTNNGGSAQWTINAMTFQSDYPKGFDFALDVTSSGGKIVEAGVIWAHAPGRNRRAPGVIDPSGKISAHWNAGGSAAVPPWVAVDYWWTLKDEAGNSFETPQKTVLHEVGHIYQQNIAGLGVDWFMEGDATFHEIQQQYDYLGRVQQMAASGNLPSLQGSGPSTSDHREGYDIGYAFFKWLATTYGPDAHRKLWTLISNGKSRADALQTVTGKDFVAMERDFRAWLGMANPEPPTPFPTDVWIFPPTPTAVEFGPTPGS